MVFDYCVIGGGIVGLATALRLLEARPGATLALLEKETELGAHQTGHNSGVIHSGIYYPPGSFKAQLCRRGARATMEFAAAHDIPVDVCGKLLVATDPVEAARMDALYERARDNAVAVERLDAVQLRHREPHIRGVGALLVPSTGIVDFRAITRAMAESIRTAGADVELGVEATGITETTDTVTIIAGERRFQARRLVVCAGLQADRLAQDGKDGPRIVPFRGEYMAVTAAKREFVRGMVYPVPDPALPFLGVHVTRHIDGGVLLGPTALLVAARDGYRRTASPAALGSALRDTSETLTWPGTWALGRTFWRTGLNELTMAASRRRFVKKCAQYVPAIGAMRIARGSVRGVRAQAVGRDGRLVDDFTISQTPGVTHVRNAPSPAATSSFALAAKIVDRFEDTSA